MKTLKTYSKFQMRKMELHDLEKHYQNIISKLDCYLDTLKIIIEEKKII